jgi:iron only hydrogenase large subunit-like protein
MKHSPAIYTEVNNCQDCYKCIKVCPVKAIKFEDYSAKLIPERCIYCGDCVVVCPANAKRVRDDGEEILKGLKRKEKIIVSLAPSYLSEYSDIDTQRLISAFKEAGFYGVSETALGAELVAKKAKEWFDKQDKGVYFSSCCPTTVQLIRKFYPKYTNNITPIASPMQSHARYLKEIYKDCKVAFVGPCISKKTELDLEDNALDYILTFQEIKTLFDTLGVMLEFTKPNEDDKFIPIKAGEGNLYPIDGGMLTNMLQDKQSIKTDVQYKANKDEDACYLTLSGVENIQSVMNDIDKLQDKKYFIELLGCKGGCVMGPVAIKKRSSAFKRVQVLDNITKKVNDKEAYNKLFSTDISSSFLSIDEVKSRKFTQKEIVEALKRVNKISEKDELNCGGCGYDNCKSFAVALLDGRAENDMCISFMRRVARDKTNILLKKMPQGVVIVNDSLQIVEANEKFATTMGKEMQDLFAIKPGLAGMDITKVLSFHKYFSSVLNSCVDVVEQDIRDGENYYLLSVFSVQDHSLVCGIIENMHAPEVRKDLVVTRTRDVINQNMKVVQKIAFLLGENASYTESMLNSIVESHQDKEQGKDNGDKL